LARDNAKALELQDEIEKTTGFNSPLPVRSISIIKRDYGRWNLFLAGIILVLMALLGLFFMI